MDALWAALVAAGIPSTILSLVVWRFKAKIEQRDRELEEREKSREELMLMIMRNSRATCVLATATARAVQRIPEAHCNGDMTAALEEAKELQGAEKDFLMEQGIKHIFGE